MHILAVAAFAMRNTTGMRSPHIVYSPGCCFLFLFLENDSGSMQHVAADPVVPPLGSPCISIVTYHILTVDSMRL